MKHRPLGKTGVEISAIGLGMMRLPLENGERGFTPSRGADVAASVQLLRHAIDSGIDYVDTAFNYLHGESEKITGLALLDGYREKVNLATKSPIWMLKEEDDFSMLLDKQLGRLQTDHIDLYLLHSVNKTDWEKRVMATNALESMREAKDSGKIRFMGFSFHDDLDTFKRIVDAVPDWDFCQIQLNYLDEDYQAGLEGLRYAAAKGLGVIIMEPLRGGYLAQVPSRVREALDCGYAEKKAPAEWAFDYLWDMPQVSTVISGMGSLDEIDLNVGYAEQSHIGMMGEEERAAISRARGVFREYDTVGCTGCNYCAVCPRGVAIPYNFRAYDDYKVTGDLDHAKWDYSVNIPLNGGKAEECISCGECEARCPQGIKISEWMPKIAELLS